MKLFVRIDRKIGEENLTEDDYKAHISYLKNVASSRYFKGGGFANTTGGMIIFSAENIKEATDLCDQDPIIITKKYTYDLNEWTIVIDSEVTESEHR